jgi:hypothetical protein
MTKKPDLTFVQPKIELPLKRKKDVEIHYHFSDTQQDRDRKQLIRDIIICISLLLTGFFIGAMF